MRPNYNLLEGYLKEQLDTVWSELDFYMNKEGVVMTKDDEEYLLDFANDIETFIDSYTRLKNPQDESNL